MKRAIAGVVLAIMLMNCAGPGSMERGGRRYGVTKGVFHGRWWNYYERGCSYLSGEFYGEAESDFREALKGRGRDSWQARTYGLHFVEYFPNRELGIVCFHNGRLDEAETLLKKSLDAVDTERAHHYLDRVLKQKIAKGIIEDESAPNVETSLQDKQLTAQRDVPIEIQVSDDVAVAAVKVNGAVVRQRGSAAKVTAQQPLLLDEGVNEVVIEAGDLADKSSAKTVTIELDLTGPNVGIYHPVDGWVTESETVLLDGVAVDRNGVTEIAIDGKVIVSSQGSGRQPFSADLPLRPGANTFIVTAGDRAGNETRTAIKVYRGEPGSPGANLWRSGRVDVAQAAGDTAVPTPAESAVSLTIKSPDPARPYRHNKTLCVSGEAVARTKLASVTINGEPLAELTGAPKESFNRRIPIDPALGDAAETKVPVSVVARDEQGHEAARNLEVSVRPVQLDSSETKMPVAVLAFTGNEVEPAVADLLRVGAETELVTAGRFRVLDRTRLRDVLTEQQLAAALANPDEAISLGKLTNAQAFLVADLFPRDQQGIEIKARAISTESSDILGTLDAFIQDKGDRAQIQRACADLAADLAKIFPRLSGELLAVREQPGGPEMLVNWTQDDGVREGLYLLVVQETAPWVDATTGEVLAPGELAPVGRGRILAVTEAGSRAKAIVQGQETVKLEQGMAAVTM